MGVGSGVLQVLTDYLRLAENAERQLGSVFSRGQLPARWLDARRVDHDLVSGGWQRLVYPAERPEESVDRAAYTLCLLEQFHRHLKYRNIFAEHSSKWRDPRAHLLSGMDWEAARDSGMNALSLPDNPRPMLADLADSLHHAYRQVAARLGDEGPAWVDNEGKLHVTALAAVPDPPSLTDLWRRAAAMIPPSCGAAGWWPAWTVCGSWCRSAPFTPDRIRHIGRSAGVEQPG
jgi:hypothetical protein